MHYYDVKSQLARFIQWRSEEAFTRGEATRDALQTIPELAAYQQTLRKRFIELLGGLPESAPDLKPHVAGRVKGDGYRLENVIFTSRPGIPVTANLYLPEGQAGPTGAVLFLCGHAIASKQHPDYMDVCRHLVGAGLVVLAMDPTGQGERVSVNEPMDRDPTLEHPTWEHSYIGCRSLPLGHALMRYFVHDAMRAIDYLVTRPEVDPQRIGVTGSSGGGTQTCTLMLVEPRLAAAAPVNSLMNRRSYLYAGGAQDAEQIWPGYTAAGYDHEDFLIAMAPRPVLVGATDSDFFPIEGTRASVTRTQRFWAMHGREGDLKLHVDHAPHCYTPALAVRVAAFLALKLNGTVLAPDYRPPRQLPAAALQVTPTGQVMTSVKNPRGIMDENVAQLEVLTALRAALDEETRLERAQTWLHQVISSPRLPVESNPRCYHVGKLHDLNAEKHLWWTQPGLMNHAVRLQADKQTVPEGGWPVTLALWQGGTLAIEQHWDWIRATCAQGRSVWVLDVSGAGEAEPNLINGRTLHGMFGTIYRLADDLLWLNDSLCALRVHDVLHTLEVIPQLAGCSPLDIQVHAWDLHNIYARLAALLNERVQRVECRGQLANYADWLRSRLYDDKVTQEFILPKALQYFDLPDIDRWLGSRLSVSGD